MKGFQIKLCVYPEIHGHLKVNNILNSYHSNHDVRRFRFFSWQIIDINKNFILSHNVFETRGFKTKSHLLYACFEKKDTIWHGPVRLSVNNCDDIL